MNRNKIVTSYYNLFSVLMSLILLGLGLYAPFLLREEWSHLNLFHKLILVMVSVVGIVNGLTVLTSKYEISLGGIKTRSLWRRRSLTWSEIKAITIVDAFIAKGIQISIASSRMPTPLLTAQMGNQEELNKAIIEAFM